MPNDTFACIADPHIPAGSSLQHDHLIAALDEIRVRHPGLLILLGDVTADGSVASYKRVLRAVADLECPVYFVRGNNENHGPDDSRFGRFLGPVRRAFSWAGWYFVLMDTSTARATQDDIQWLRSVLKKRPSGTPTAIFSHYYLESLPEDEGQALLSVLRDFDVRYYIAAHQHTERRATFGSVRQRVLTCLDPDKARGSFPGFYWGKLAKQNMTLRFQPVALLSGTPLTALEDHLGICQYQADSNISPWIGLCRELGLRYLQVRLGAPENCPSRDALALAGQANIGLIAHLPSVRFNERGEWLNEKQVIWAAGWAKDHECALAILHPPKLTAATLGAGRKRVADTDLGRRILDTYRRITASLEGLPVAIENNSSKREAMTFGSMPGHLRWLAKGISSTINGLGFCFDVGHAQASLHKMPIREWFRALGGEILALHCHLGDPKTRETHGVIADAFGATNWYGVSAWIAKTCPHALVLMETKSLDDARRSVATLRDMWKRVDAS